MLLPGGLLSLAAAQEKAYYGIALIGDPHLPGKNLPAKISALRTIDGWPDIDRVVVLGDICKESGTPGEYAAAKTFFNRLRKPARFVAGNHDYIYADKKNALGKRVKALRDVRRVKLERFVESFGLSGAYDSERLGGYLMIYLSTQENPQIFLWISGHMHVPAASESFSAAINLYGGRVMNIHNPDMERKTIWTNVLRLYPDRVVIRT